MKLDRERESYHPNGAICCFHSRDFSSAGGRPNGRVLDSLLPRSDDRNRHNRSVGTSACGKHAGAVALCIKAEFFRRDAIQARISGG